MDTSQCCRSIPHLLVQTKNFAALITTLYRTNYNRTLRLLLITSTAVEYICYIHCCGHLYTQHPLLWTTYAASTAVECICNIHCCGICLLPRLLWNIYMLHPLLWIYGLHPLLCQLTTTSVVSSNVHGRGPVLDFHFCESGQLAVPVTDSTVI